MKILLVHDRQEAADAILASISKLDRVEAEITHVEDGATARAKMHSVIYDLVIIDLTLPYIKNKTEISYTVARDLLHELFSLSTLHPPGDVIGLTRDPDAVASVAGDVGSHLMSIITETGDNNWLAALEDKVLYAWRAAEARQFTCYKQYGLDCLIVVALDEEFAPYKSIFGPVPNKYFSGASDFAFRDKDGGFRKGVIFSIGKSGQPRVASYTQSLISIFRPRLVAMSGICGGFKDKANIGDLMIFETVYDWDYGKWADEKDASGSAIFLSRPVPLSILDTEAHKVARKFVASKYHLNPALRQRIKELSLGKIDGFACDIVHAASGSAVVAHSDVVKHISGISDAIKVVDMESYGLYQAAIRTHAIVPEVICIKAVSDRADKKKDDAVHTACCELSADALATILREHWDFPKTASS